MPSRELIIIGVVLLLGLVVLGAIFLIPKNSNNHLPLECSPACSKDQKCVEGECKCACSPDQYCQFSDQHCIPWSKCGAKQLPDNPPSGCTLDNIICPADDPDAGPDWPTTWRCPGPCDSAGIDYPTHRDGCQLEDLVCQDENGWFCPQEKNTHCSQEGTRYLKIVDQYPTTTPCTCVSPYAGDTCQCSPHETCHDHGTPDKDCKCQCDSISWGDHCENQCGPNSHYQPMKDPDCHGQAYNCTCDEGYKHDCTSSENCVPKEVCCGHGTLQGGTCVCQDGYSNKINPLCCEACQNGGKWKPDKTCDCTAIVPTPTGKSISDCSGNTVQQVRYFTGIYCQNEVDCYNAVGPNPGLGLDANGKCICPKDSCGDSCEINDTACSCHGTPCGSANSSLCKCLDGYEGDTCACHKTDILDPTHGTNLPVEKTMCQDFNMLACTDTKVKPPCITGGVTFNNYCEIKPTSCTAWQDQMNYIGGSKPYDCVQECQASCGKDAVCQNVVCTGSPPALTVTCQKQCLDPSDPIQGPIVKAKCATCNPDTEWCLCDGVGDHPWEWRCENIYNVVNTQCMTPGKDPQSCCPKTQPDYMKKYCPADAATCIDCGLNKDGEYGLFWYCEGLTKMPNQCVYKMAGGLNTDTYGGQSIDIIRDAPVYPTINNDECTADHPRIGLITEAVSLPPFGTYWDKAFKNPPGHVSNKPSPGGSFVDLNIDSNNVYYNLPDVTADVNILCLGENPCKNGGNFNSKVTYKEAPTDGFLKDCNLGVCHETDRFKNQGGIILKDGVCSCPVQTAGANCEFSRGDTCGGHGTPQNDGSCICDDATYGGKNCQFTKKDTCGNIGLPLDDGTCVCEDLFHLGDKCQNTCNDRGTINANNKCQCAYQKGYTGKYCDVRAHDAFLTSGDTGLGQDHGIFTVPGSYNAKNVLNAEGDYLGTYQQQTGWDIFGSEHPTQGNYMGTHNGNIISWATDFGGPTLFTWTITPIPDPPAKDCSGNGTKVNGSCECFPNFSGSDCADHVIGYYYLIMPFEQPEKRYVIYDPNSSKYQTYKGPKGANALLISFERYGDYMVMAYVDYTNTKKYLAPGPGTDWSSYYLAIQIKSATTSPSSASPFRLALNKAGYYLQYLGQPSAFLGAPNGDDDIDFTDNNCIDKALIVGFEPVNFYYITIQGEPDQTKYVSYDPTAKPDTYKGPRTGHPMLITTETNAQGNILIAYVDQVTKGRKYLAPDPSYSGWESYWLANQIQSGVTDPSKASEFKLTQTDGGYYLYCLGIPNLVLCMLGDGNMDIDFADFGTYAHIVVNFEVDLCDGKCSESAPTCCSGTCSDLRSDIHNCGTCENDCGNTQRQQSCNLPAPFQGSILCCSGTCFCCLSGSSCGDTKYCQEI